MKQVLIITVIFAMGFLSGLVEVKPWIITDVMADEDGQICYFQDGNNDNFFIKFEGDKMVAHGKCNPECK